MTQEAATNPLWLMARRVSEPVRSLLRLLFRPEFRSARAARMQYGNRAFQGVPTTSPDRFPVLFRQCQLLLQDVPAPRILSFGCATGEEVASLATYMPSATVVGVEINRWCLRQCRRRVVKARCEFQHRYSRAFLKGQPFDAIFCMAVFQRTEHRVNGASPDETGFTFDCFEQELAILNAKLKPGGYLFIDHADFRFEDTSVAAEYRAVVFEGSSRGRDRAVWGRDNRKMSEQHVAQRCFQKRGVAASGDLGSV